ncbi:MAG: hypothetical protein WBP88_14995 [Nitrososphaeraceae archaeon]
MGSPSIPYGNRDVSKISNNDDSSRGFETRPTDSWLKSADITYVGGHKAHPTSVDTAIYIYDDRIEIGSSEADTELKILYANMIDIENMDEKKISALRVVGLGLVFVPLAIVGAMWKKKHIYTVIQYRDEMDEQTIVLDFGKYIEELQPFIYRKMLDYRRK